MDFQYSYFYFAYLNNFKCYYLDFCVFLTSFWALKMVQTLLYNAHYGNENTEDKLVQQSFTTQNYIYLVSKSILGSQGGYQEIQISTKALEPDVSLFSPS